MKKPYRIRAKEFIIKQASVRMSLIRNNKSKHPDNDNILILAENMLNELIYYNTDAQLAHIIITRFDIISNILVRNNSYKNIAQELQNLLNEAHKLKT